MEQLSRLLDLPFEIFLNTSVKSQYRSVCWLPNGSVDLFFFSGYQMGK